MKNLLLAIAFLVALVGPFGGKAEASGWGGCSWGIDYPYENSVHDLTSPSVWFSCDTTGTRILIADLRLNNSLWPDTILVTKSVTFSNTWHGEFSITDTSCNDVTAIFVYHGTAKIKNPDTGNSSSRVPSENHRSTIHC